MQALDDMANEMLTDMDALPATFTGSAGTFELSAAVVEADISTKTSTRDQVIGTNAVITTLRDVRLRKGGTLTFQDGLVYRLDKMEHSGWPGLTDWGCERLAGNALPVVDLSDIVPREETVLIGGVQVPCHVNQSAETQELGPDGISSMRLRTILAVLPAHGAHLKAGALVGFRGRTYALVRPPMADGAGFVKLVL